MKTILTARPN